MVAGNSAAAEIAERTLVITRLFEAPRELVFAAWTRPEHMMRWWGPRGFTLFSCQADVRPGGAFRFGMRSPQGTTHWTHGLYHEVVSPERLAFTTSWEDERGGSKYETLVTLTFAAHGDETELTLNQAVFESVTSRDRHHDGWSSALDCLAEYLAEA